MMGWEVAWKIGLLISSFRKQCRDLPAPSRRRVLSFIQKQCIPPHPPTPRQRDVLYGLRGHGAEILLPQTGLMGTHLEQPVSSPFSPSTRSQGCWQPRDGPYVFSSYKTELERKTILQPWSFFFFFLTISMLPALQFCKLILWMLAHTHRVSIGTACTWKQTRRADGLTHCW